MQSQQCNCLHSCSYGIKGTLNPNSTLLSNEPIPQVLKQIVNLSCLNGNELKQVFNYYNQTYKKLMSSLEAQVILFSTQVLFFGVHNL